MSNTNTGGPAFPSGLIDPSTPEDAVQSLHNGMTLRDYFAAKAMQSLIRTAPHGTAFGENNETTNLTYAFASYAMADAMLKAGEA
jgi:hypothetical protein